MSRSKENASSSSSKKKDSVVAEFTVSGNTLRSSSDEQKSPCLHCHNKGGGVQVSCDECASHICNDCHWCHEFQANHEIRVCDRCDGFYCKGCDEMDQCDDCGEVVCGGCSSLLSCKFCGGGLCPDCATACGKCGIVLCARDSKFAVECDTCKLSYCLVCLASSNKDPCVRCGHRPSKRMEQLVHLRLKSIYKAFQQSNPKGGKNRESASTRAVAAAAAAACGAKESSGKDKKSEKNEKTFSARQAEADMAAASLLAELEEEEQVQKKKSSKKKKKKAQKKKQNDGDAVEEEQDDDKESKDDSSDEKDEEPEIIMEEEEETTPTKTDGSMEAEELPTPPPEEEKMDPDEVRLYEMVADSDGEGIEALLAEMKGVPGKAALRKNAKKALKRLREDKVREEEEAAAAAEMKANEEAEAAAAAASSSSYKPPEPLLTLVSRNVHSNSKAECVLHMSPQVVGWVIGKGGQRIRDLMDESGSKVWIDQDTMGTSDSRVVYVSGSTKAVDDAVRRIKDLVAKAPVGGATTGTTTITSQNPTKMPPSSPEAKPMEAPSMPPKSSPARIRTKSASKDKDWAIHEIDCEARFVPLLIGRRGWTIKHIQDESGARVDIDQSVTPRKIKISGKKDSVATAIRMVKDVLSYPHAQLDKSGTAIAAAAAAAAAAAKSPSGAPRATPMNASADELASLEAERNLSNHSPPPSSLIMTGDVRTISASSSLSSTPEPSMTSKNSNYKHPLSSADLIPPNFAAAAATGTPYLQASLHSDLPIQPGGQPPIGMVSGPSIGAVGSATGLSQPQQDPRFMNQPPSQVGGQPFSQAMQQGGGMPFGNAQQQQQLVQGIHRASSAPIGNVGAPGYGQPQQQQQQQPLGGGLFGQQQQQQQQPIGGQSLLREALMGASQQQHLQGTLGQTPMQQQQQAAPMPSFPTDSFQPNAHLLFQKQQSQMPSGNVNETETFDLFGRSRNLSGGMQNQNNNVNPPTSYLFQGGPGPPHRQSSDSQIHPNSLYAEPQLRRNSTGGAPSMPLKRGGSMPADSDIVDSLFAVGGGGVGGNEQSLLSGIQGLDLNNNGVGGGAGWWANNNTNTAGGGVPGAVQQTNSGLSGGMLNGSQQHQQQQRQQQHPGQQQSRFDWG